MAELDALAVMGHVYVIDQRFSSHLKKENPANFGLPFTVHWVDHDKCL